MATNTLVGAPKEKRSKHNLSCQSFTTTDLFKIQPVFAREVFKGDRFNIRMAQINRVDQLPVSSFVEINNRHDWFYVKYNQVWKPFDSFIARTPYAFEYLNTVVSKVPCMTLSELFCFFCGTSTLDGTSFTLVTFDPATVDTTLSLSTTAQMRYDFYSGHDYDFIYVGDYHLYDAGQTAGTAAAIPFKLNHLGRYIFGILNSLGYRIPKFIIDDTLLDASQKTAVHQFLGEDNLSECGSFEVSMLPLMAYLSVLVNYYVPTKFRDYKYINSMSYLTAPILHNSTIAETINGDNGQDVQRGEIIRILLSLFYGSDYFTDSLQSPYAQINKNVHDPNIPNPIATTLSGVPYQIKSAYAGDARTLIGGVSDNPNRTPQIRGSYYTNMNTNAGYSVVPDATVSQYLLAALKSVSTESQIRALTKNNLLGSMLQQFGIKPESADMIPYKLSSHRDSIVVEPVVSQADTFDSNSGNGTMLGYKAGQGTGKAEMKEEFDFDNYGILICINSISPEYTMSDGLHREMVHILPDDFFNPQNVNLGYQPVGNFELTINADNTDGSKRKIDDTFGFQNYYAEYGYKRDFMGGDFCVNSINNGLDSFHFNRKFDGIEPTYLNNNLYFAQAKRIRLNGMYNRFESEYDRIFSVDDPNYDHIQQWTYFDILATRSIPANGEFIVGDDENRVIEGKPVMDNINN